MDSIPGYLKSIVNAADYRLDGAFDEETFGNAEVKQRIASIGESLREWSFDTEFWRTLITEREHMSEVLSSEDVLWHLTTPAFRSEETEKLRDALSDVDPHLVDLIMANLRIPQRRAGRADVARVRVVLIRLEEEARNVSGLIAEDAARGMGFREAQRVRRFLRKAFKVASGGILIVADIVTPDPTLITKVASVVGGFATICT